MERVDLTLDNRRDRNVQSRPYTTSYDIDVLKKKKCIEIQRCGHYISSVSTTWNAITASVTSSFSS